MLTRTRRRLDVIWILQLYRRSTLVWMMFIATGCVFLYAACELSFGCWNKISSNAIGSHFQRRFWLFVIVGPKLLIRPRRHCWEPNVCVGLWWSAAVITNFCAYVCMYVCICVCWCGDVGDKCYTVEFILDILVLPGAFTINFSIIDACTHTYVCIIFMYVPYNLLRAGACLLYSTAFVFIINLLYHKFLYTFYAFNYLPCEMCLFCAVTTG